MHSAVQRFRLTGTVGSTEFTDENILSGSFSITNQCSGNNEIQIGQVYVGELDATFLNLPLTRYSLKGMQITPSFGLRLADGTREAANGKDNKDSGNEAETERREDCAE